MLPRDLARCTCLVGMSKDQLRVVLVRRISDTLRGPLVFTFSLSDSRSNRLVPPRPPLTTILCLLSSHQELANNKEHLSANPFTLVRMPRCVGLDQLTPSMGVLR